MGARAERRAVIALLAVFALLVQALIPSIAGAAPAPLAQGVICTSAGMETAPADGSLPGHVGRCDHCVCPAAGAAPPPPAVDAALPRVTYVAAAAPLPRAKPPPPARAPPRPPGQGPPPPNA